jgi:hypothetical protein
MYIFQRLSLGTFHTARARGGADSLGANLSGSYPHCPRQSTVAVRADRQSLPIVEGSPGCYDNAAIELLYR